MDYKYLLIVDLESTCDDNNLITKQQREIIEIAGIIVTWDFTIVSQFQTFVQPIQHPILTSFCQNLTHITQENVDNAPLLLHALQQFNAWLEPFHPFLFCSWGNYDKNQLKKDYEKLEISYPLGIEHVNLKTKFSQTQNLKQRYGMEKALRLCQIPLQGVQHRAIDDVKNILLLLPFIFGKEKIKVSESILYTKKRKDKSKKTETLHVH